MDEERFQRIIAAYGAQADRWPSHERAAAQAFTRANPEKAEALLREAQILDQALAAAPAHALDAAFMGRVLQSAAQTHHKQRSLGWALPATLIRGGALTLRGQLAGGFAAAFLLSSAFGYAVGHAQTRDALGEALIIDAFAIADVETGFDG